MGWQFMLPDAVRDLIDSEIDQIDELFAQYRDLLDRAATKEPDHVQRAALASVLHSFYTGVEGILLTVAKRVDEQVPHGSHWHRELLDQSVTATDLRSALLSGTLRNNLDRYLAFRHFFRQAYSFSLRWNEMRDLVVEANSTWSKVKGELLDWLARHDRPE